MASSNPDPHLEENPEDEMSDSALMAQMGFSIFGQQKRKPDEPKTDKSKGSPSTQHQSKRQKRVDHQASGANRTPLSIRQTTTSGPDTSTTRTGSGPSAQDGADDTDDAHDGSPRYADSPRDEQGDELHDQAHSTDEALRNGAGYGARSNESHRQAGGTPSAQGSRNDGGAFFRPSFVVDDPWAGMVPVYLE